MSKIIAIPSADPEQEHQDVYPVARMINQLMKEDPDFDEVKTSTFEDQFMEQLEKGDYLEIFNLFAEQYNLVVNQPEKKGAKSEKLEKIDCYFSTLVYLLSLMSTLKKLEAAIVKVISLVSQDNSYASVRLRVLMTSYNSIPVAPQTAQLSKKIFFAVLRYASENSLFHELVPYLSFFESWIQNWKLSDNTENLKELYYLAAQELPRLSLEQMNNLEIDKREELAFKWLKKYLEAETQVDERSIAAIKLFVVEIIKLPSVYQVEGLLEIALLQQAKSKNADVAKLCELLELFVSGTLEAWEQFKAKNGAFLQKEQINEEEMVKKLRVLTLCSICEGRTEVPLSELQHALKVSDVDNTIIEASHYNVLLGRIDEVKQILQVQCVLQRRFQQKEWQKLDQIVGEWIGKIGELKNLHTQMSVQATN